MSQGDVLRDESGAPVPEPIQKNIEAIERFYQDEERKLSSPQSAVERLFFLFGSIGYLFFALLLVAAWVACNLYGPRLGWPQFDPPPFHWLQGLIALNSLLITIVILIRENRTARLAEHRAHLDLQINLSAEQKTATVIRLLEELRRDLPEVRNRYDPEAEQMKQPTDPNAVLQALKGQSGPESAAGQGGDARQEAK